MDQEIKNSLRKVYNLDKYIEAKEAQKKKIRERLIYKPNKLSHEPRALISSDRILDGISDIDELQTEIDKAIDNSIAIQKKITKEIDLIQDNKQKALLIRRYLNCEDWDYIADKMGYSISGIHKLHSIALQKFESVHISG